MKTIRHSTPLWLRVRDRLLLAIAHHVLHGKAECIIMSRHNGFGDTGITIAHIHDPRVKHCPSTELLGRRAD